MTVAKRFASLALAGLLLAPAGCAQRATVVSKRADLAKQSAWPMDGHDAQRTGRAAHTGPVRPRVLWSLPTTGGATGGCIVGRRGTVYFLTGAARMPEDAASKASYDQLWAVGPSGRKLWVFRVELPAGRQPHSGRTTPAERLYASIYFVQPSPTLHERLTAPAEGPDGSIYFAARDGTIYAVRPDGRRKWALRTGRALASSPCVGADGAVYVGTKDGHLYSVSGAHGRLYWTFAGKTRSLAVPAVGNDGTVYFCTDSGGIYALTPRGKLKWRFRTRWLPSSPPAVGADGTIVFGANSRVLIALRPGGGLKWRLPLENAGPTVLGADGTIYASTGTYDETAAVVAVGPNGRDKWHFSTNGWASAAAVDGRGTLYVASTGTDRVPVGEVLNGGVSVLPWKWLYAVRPDGSKLWALATAGLISSPVVGGNGRLYSRGVDGRLYCVGDR